MAVRTVTAPFVAWPHFLRLFQWGQGEHITVIGRTGSGKTHLSLQLLPRRRYVLVIATKPRDPLIAQLKRRGYHVTREWPVPHEVYPRVVYWPRIEQVADVAGQRAGIARVLADVYKSGAWAVYCDEIRYLADTLGLRSYLELLWLQGRSLNVSLVGGTQRPAWVPPEAFSQASHLFLFRETDQRNLKRLGEIGGIDSDLLRQLVARLDWDSHEVLYVSTVAGHGGDPLIVRTRAPRR